MSLGGRPSAHPHLNEINLVTSNFRLADGAGRQQRDEMEKGLLSRCPTDARQMNSFPSAERTPTSRQ